MRHAHIKKTGGEKSFSKKNIIYIYIYVHVFISGQVTLIPTPECFFWHFEGGIPSLIPISTKEGEEFPTLPHLQLLGIFRPWFATKKCFFWMCKRLDINADPWRIACWRSALILTNQYVVTVSDQIIYIIFHQARFPSNKGMSLTKRYFLAFLGRVRSRANLSCVSLKLGCFGPKIDFSKVFFQQRATSSFHWDCNWNEEVPLPLLITNPTITNDEVHDSVDVFGNSFSQVIFFIAHL